MLLIAYDGSDHAKAAIRAAAEIAPRGQVTILTVYESLLTDAGTPKSDAGFPDDVEAADARALMRADSLAIEGATLATDIALDAATKTAPAHQSVAETILTVAGDLDIAALVIGTHGATGLRSVLRGSVAHRVLDHASQPVILVPLIPT